MTETPHLLREVIEHDLDLLALHRLRPERYPYLLESAAWGTPQGRYDILFAFPGETLALHEDRLEAPATLEGGADQGRFLQALDAWWRQEQATPEPEPQLPFTGGWFLYLGYELAAEIEPTLELPRSEFRLPTAFATRVRSGVVRDHGSGHVFVFAERGAAAQLQAILDDIREVAPARTDAAPMPRLQLREDLPEKHLQGVERVKRYIRDGDVFQVNLSRAWRADLDQDARPADVYARLRRSNPGPFAGLARYGDSAIISSSPERLVEHRQGRVQTRPIAGTRRRDADPEEDARLTRELVAHPKERAEHVMLIDLERNDLGRVCRPGTVVADEIMVLESYRHVHHIVSNVRGELRAGVSPGQLIAAVFPGGTITGCPKVRCMEILAELEGTARGPYTGSFGYLNLDGSMDLNILIRTMLLENRHIVLRAGGGIVADSDPQKELEETRAKARGLLLALQEPA